MKPSRILLAAICCGLITGCVNPFGKLERIFPDGASVTMRKPQLTVTGNALNISADEISWRGTNGFPYEATNTNDQIFVKPAGGQFQRLK